MDKYPDHIICLARAWQAGEDVIAPLHDALEELGYYKQAVHFSDNPCTARYHCTVIEMILGQEYKFQKGHRQR